MVYLWLILLVAAGLVQIHTSPKTHTHTYTQSLHILWSSCNLCSDVAILLQFSHAQLPLIHVAPHSLSAGSNRQGEGGGTKAGEKETKNGGCTVMELERKLGHREAQERRQIFQRSEDREVMMKRRLCR